ncbi:MAG TPA: ComEA family DNA-binding protein [Jatrophihabitans sp.]|nr:ComEA family DNA-binding protein [Jatrophihabitans sp.]
MRRGAESRSAGLRELAARLRLPAAGRANPGRGGLLALATVGVLVALVVGGWVLSSRPQRIPVAAVAASATGVAGPATGTAGSAAPSNSATGDGLVVDVAGKVRRPGVYRLPSGARVQDAVTAAGGVLPGVDPAAVNLARRLADGEQVLIGLPGAAPVAGAGGGSGAGPAGTSGPLDLNAATVEQLDALPGVGPVLAQRIVDWRTEHGRFGSVEDLSKVSGIGDAKLADLKPLITVS